MLMSLTVYDINTFEIICQDFRIQKQLLWFPTVILIVEELCIISYHHLSFMDAVLSLLFILRTIEFIDAVLSSFA